jgi:DNA-binding MarR family transcriptional regulator
MPAGPRPLDEQVGVIVDLLPLIVKNLRIPRLLENVRPNLGISQTLVLHALERAPGNSVSMGDLADEVGVSVPTTTGLVDRLARERLVERRPHPSDRRIVLVGLTDEGRQVARRAAAYLAEMMGKLLVDLEAGEREGLAHAFERVFDLSVRIQEEQRRMVALA